MCHAPSKGILGLTVVTPCCGADLGHLAISVPGLSWQFKMGDLGQKRIGKQYVVSQRKGSVNTVMMLLPLWWLKELPACGWEWRMSWPHYMSRQFQERPLLWPGADAGVTTCYLPQQTTALNEAVWRVRAGDQGYGVPPSRTCTGSLGKLQAAMAGYGSERPWEGVQESETVAARIWLCWKLTSTTNLMTSPLGMAPSMDYKGARQFKHFKRHILNI